MNAGGYSAFWVPGLFHVVGLIAVWLYYDRRSAWTSRPAPRSVVFRCEDCRRVYADDSGVPRVACPRCGRHNDAVRK